MLSPERPVAIEPVVAVATAENVAQCRVTDAANRSIVIVVS